VSFGPLVITIHAIHGYLTTPIVFGDFPAVVGSPFFLGAVPAPEEAPMTAAQPINAGGNKPHSPKSRVFSVHMVSHTAAPVKKGRQYNNKGNKPVVVTSRSGKTVLVGDLRIRLDGGEPIIPKDRYVPTISTSNHFAPLQKMHEGKVDFKKKSKSKIEDIATEQRPHKMKQIWVTKEEAQAIRKARAGKPTKMHGQSEAAGHLPSVVKAIRPQEHKRKGVYSKPNFIPQTSEPIRMRGEELTVNPSRRVSVFERLGAPLRTTEQQLKKRRVVRKSEDHDIRIFACYVAGKDPMEAIGDAPETVEAINSGTVIGTTHRSTRQAARRNLQARTGGQEATSNQGLAHDQVQVQRQEQIQNLSNDLVDEEETLSIHGGDEHLPTAGGHAGPAIGSVNRADFLSMSDDAKYETMQRWQTEMASLLCEVKRLVATNAIRPEEPRHGQGSQRSL
jgi:hypothetical protein